MVRYYYSIIQRFLQFKYKSRDGVRVLMFHQVYNDKSPLINESISITKKCFINLLQKLQNNSIPIISPDVIDCYIDKKAVVITFDDVYADVCQNAIPYLKKHNIPYTVFISDSFVNKENYITLNDIKGMLLDPLCTVGYHTKNHLITRGLDQNQIKEEIDCSDFKKNIGFDGITDFAFPYGSLFAVHLKAYKIAFESGYKRVYSTISVPYSLKWKQKFGAVIPRININENNQFMIIKNLI